MPDANQHIELARRFALALDRCHYETARQYLDDHCRYERPHGDALTGPQAILDSYRQCDEQARREFDEVGYFSSVAVDASGKVHLNFVDRLRLREREHTFRCAQIVRFGPHGKITHIELRELPGERERLNEFRHSAVPST